MYLKNEEKGAEDPFPAEAGRTRERLDAIDLEGNPKEDTRAWILHRCRGFRCGRLRDNTLREAR